MQTLQEKLQTMNSASDLMGAVVDMERWGRGEVVGFLDVGVGLVDVVVVRGVDESILAEQVQRAFYDDERAKFWSKTSVEVVWCERTAWVMVDAVWWVQTLQEQAREKGTKGRDVKFTMFPQANHFVSTRLFVVDYQFIDSIP